MKQRVLTIGLMAGCVILLLISFMVYAGSDRKAPVITIEDGDVTYTEGDDYTELLEGVTAEDNSDGDITDKIFIEKIIPLSEEEAIVCYGVLDTSNNVGKATRTVAYHAGDIALDEDEEEDEDDVQDEDSAEEDVDPAVLEAEANVAALNLQPDGARPVMALTAESVAIKAGETFDPVSVVAGAVDDADSVETLYQHIHAEGEYNTEVPGTYQIQYYVSDSDGNTSDPHIFTLVVE